MSNDVHEIYPPLEMPPHVPRLLGMCWQVWTWLVVGLLTIAAVVFAVR